MEFKERPLKVAFIVGEFPDKIGTFILNQATGLLDRGVDLKIFSLLRPREEVMSDEIRKYNLMDRIYYLNVPRNKLVRGLKAGWIIIKNLFRHPIKIWKPLNFFRYGNPALTLNPLFFSDYFLGLKENFDILHCHFGQRGIYGAALKDIGVKGKLVTSFYGGDLSYFVETTSSRVYAPLFEKGDLFLPLSENFKKRLIDMGCDEKKIAVHRVGTDLSKFGLVQKKKEKSGITLLTIARFVEKKGHKYLLEALPLVLEKCENVKVLLIGDGPLKKDLETLVKNLKLEKYVAFAGSISADELPRAYSKGDIYVLPSITSANGDTEGTPVSIIEAQACGLPAVSTQHSGIPEIIVNNETGFLVPEKDTKALAEKIIYLIKHPALRKKMGKKGNKFILENYDKEKQSKKLLEIYQKIDAPPHVKNFCF